MKETILLGAAVIIGLGIFSQWLAWRISWPTIVIMSLVGLFIGPGLNIVSPQEALGEFYKPIIAMAVALVLFEGSNSLNVKEINGVTKSVWRIITVGAFIAWILGSLAAHYIAGLSLGVSFVIGGIFIVTGPTVIIPLLRQAKLKPRTAAILKWEGIIVDPIGPLVALFAFEIVVVMQDHNGNLTDLAMFFVGAIVAAIIGVIVGIFLSYVVKKQYIPEYMTTPVIFAMVLLSFALSEQVMHETGMLCVTVLGVILAKSKHFISTMRDVDHFAENMSMILTSTVFILITASLKRETIMEVFSIEIILFVLAMLFIVRPLSIVIATINTELSFKERALLGWIAPRGIVALTVSSYFASIMKTRGFEDAELIPAITFALVFITVCAHGFTLSPLAKMLGLAHEKSEGLLIIGANKFTYQFASFCKQQNIPVMVVDNNAKRLSIFEENGIEVHHGQILTEEKRLEMDLTEYSKVLCMTDSFVFNLLSYETLSKQFGTNNTFLLPVYLDETYKDETIPEFMKSHLLFKESAVFEDLIYKIKHGHEIVGEVSSESRKLSVHDDLDGTLLFIIHKESKEISMMTTNRTIKTEKGDMLVFLKSNENTQSQMIDIEGETSLNG
mgnify:FL=1